LTAGTGSFDARFREYGQWFADNQAVYRSELRAVRHLLPSAGKGLAVDFGSGKFAQPLSSCFTVCMHSCHTWL
jgi:hypothetical protein